ncbi:MAG: ethanolamine ammonia-lyase subunit EutC [Eubacteriaceae bacterium]|jgi:ethanolamine ammonia-lyase small subunit
MYADAEDLLTEKLKKLQAGKLQPASSPGQLEFESLAAKTSARLGVGHAGTRYRTATMLAFQADHAAAVDAVTSEVPDSFIRDNDLVAVQTQCSGKEMYITRPDLGKRLCRDSIQTVNDCCRRHPDIQIIIGDGLSAAAVQTNAVPVMEMVTENARRLGLTVGTPVFVHYARVAVLNEIGRITGADVVVHLIGERPGLATDKSLSAYVSYRPDIGTPESHWNCVSNIHDRGTPPVKAAAMILELAEQMMIQKTSGTALTLPSETNSRLLPVQDAEPVPEEQKQITSSITG